MDLTIEVMLPRRGATGAELSEPANPKYRLLALVAVYPLKSVPTVGMPFTGYVHLTGVPERAAWAGLSEEEIVARINSRLCKLWLDANREIVERREFAGIAASVPPGARTALQQDRQVTVTWNQFKAFVQNVRDARALDDADLD